MNPTETQTNDGGSYHVLPLNYAASGASLRDEFAKAAMSELIRHKERLMANSGYYEGVDVEEVVAIAAYLQADAMLRARTIPAPPKEETK